MRALRILAVSLAACASHPSGAARVEEGRVRVVLRQFYQGSVPVVLENLAGRDLVALRSRPLKRGEPAVAYVPDDVMQRLLRELDRHGFYDHAGPRPADPAALGARGEIAVVGADERATAFLRRAGQGARASAVFSDCLGAVIAVYNFHKPTLQAYATEEEFGVRRAKTR
ncbi:MAG: hypothetical protein ACREID_01550 [Planctomycetota bacterium]